MPGNSLWLLPPPNHPLYTLLPSLSLSLSPDPANPHLFQPHITLAGNLPSDFSLSSLPTLPIPRVRFTRVVIGDAFFRKVVLEVDIAGVEELGIAAQGGEKDATLGWWPHCSILYAEKPKDQWNQEEVEEKVRKGGVRWGEESRREGVIGGWEGGRVAIVETWREVDEWKEVEGVDLK